jgi:hypothetical protein
MRTHKELKQIKEASIKKQLFTELTDLENILILKEMLAGEEPTLDEIGKLFTLRQKASRYGYSLPKSKWEQ